MDMKLTIPVAMAAILLLPAAGAQQEQGGLASAITSGNASFRLRYRLELVDQDSISKNATASTVLLRLNYETNEWNGWSALAEFDHVAEALADNFNSGAGTSSPRRNRYPVVADPDGTDLNQFYIQYAPDDDWQIRLGRQRINLDDQRHVGGVGWRQNEQTYDSVSFRYTGLEDTTLFYSFVGNVNRIFGEGSPAGDHNEETHLVNGSIRLSDRWTAVGYAYLIDNEDAPALSTNTFGLRLSGKQDVGAGRIAVLGEFATQSDAANAPVSFDTEYLRIQGTWTKDRFSVGAGFESLGSDNGQGFRTPLATLHAFNGWADQFLATPANGLDDLYIKAGLKDFGWNIQATYHDFSAEAGEGDYGTEFNLSASRTFADRYDLLLKSAFFDGEDGRTDVTKFWMMLTARF